MSIETEYKGYTIRWSDNEDAWSCLDITFSHPSLNKVKEKIDIVVRKDRKSAGLNCLYIGGDYQGSTSWSDAQIIEYLGPKIDRRRPARNSFSHGPRYVKDHGVAAMIERTDKRSRTKEALTCFVMETPEVMDALEYCKTLEGEIASLRKRRDEIRASIPRVTIDLIDKLVKISDLDPTGGITDEDPD